MFLDKMPAAVYNRTLDQTLYHELIPIGYIDDDGTHYIYNHMEFTVTLDSQLNEDGEQLYDIVGFQVEPKSFHYDEEMLHTLHPGEPEKWTDPSDEDLKDINTMRDHTDKRKSGIDVSPGWMKKSFGAWLGA